MNTLKIDRLEKFIIVKPCETFQVLCASNEMQLSIKSKWNYTDNKSLHVLKKKSVGYKYSQEAHINTRHGRLDKKLSEEKNYNKLSINYQ